MTHKAFDHLPSSHHQPSSSICLLMPTHGMVPHWDNYIDSHRVKIKPQRTIINLLTKHGRTNMVKEWSTRSPTEPHTWSKDTKNFVHLITLVSCDVVRRHWGLCYPTRGRNPLLISSTLVCGEGARLMWLSLSKIRSWHGFQISLRAWPWNRNWKEKYALQTRYLPA